MEASVVTDPVPMVEEREITFAATTGPRPAEPVASDGSGGGDGNEASCPWSLSKDEQVRNLKENWKKAVTALRMGFPESNAFETSPWFVSVVDQLRADPRLESSEFEIDESLTGRLFWGVRMTSLDLAILMGDLKMVQNILERSSVPDKLIRGWLFDSERASEFIKVLNFGGPEETFFSHTPLHLAIVAGGNSQIVDVLLEKGADVHAQNWLTKTPLDLTCDIENVTMLLKLLEKDKKEGKHPLHVATRNTNVNFLEILSGPNPDVPNFKAPDFKASDRKGRTPLHYLAASPFHGYDSTKNTLECFSKHWPIDMKALDSMGLSPFYVAVLYGNIEVVSALLESKFKDHIRLNEACDKNLGPPIQIAFEGKQEKEDFGLIGGDFGDMEKVLMECDPVKGYMERLYRDRQVYVDAANAILVGAALIASVTFASWLQPPLNYTSYSGEGYSSSVPTPSTSDLNYVDVEHNIPLRAFWVFNALSFYFAIATVVCGARSVLPRSHLFIKETVEKLRTNLLVTSTLLACSMLFVIIAFAIGGTIVLTPLLKYQWYMIVPTLVGGMVCIISLVFLVKSMVENYFPKRLFDKRLEPNRKSVLKDSGYKPRR